MDSCTADSSDRSIKTAVDNINKAVEAEKCLKCGCFHNALKSIDSAFLSRPLPDPLATAVSEAKKNLGEKEYDCIGCEVCYPAIITNALNLGVETCSAEKAIKREGWPPMPGNYTVLRYNAPSAVCTLTDNDLANLVASSKNPAISITGTLQTENLGIERLIQNILANPNIRFLIICGADSRSVVGHMPGQSLVALAENGIDESSRIVGAKGKRPLLLNIPREAVEHFRSNVGIIDLIGNVRLDEIINAANECSRQNTGPSTPFTAEISVTAIDGYIPDNMALDPCGYFVIHVDRYQRCIFLEHYKNDGTLDAVIKGKKAAELYMPIIEKGLISRLDHAAYIGRELALAVKALLTGEHYVQDGAFGYRIDPERKDSEPE